MPLRKQISPFKAVPQMKAFEIEEFISQLKHTGPLLTCGVKGDWCGLYRRFIRSPNFESWLQMRLIDVGNQLSAIHLDVLCTADFSAEIIKGRHQVEIVDLVFKLKNRLDDRLDRGRQSQIQSQLNNILNVVDDELKCILLSNEALKSAFQQEINVEEL